MAHGSSALAGTARLPVGAGDPPRAPGRHPVTTDAWQERPTGTNEPERGIHTENHRAGRDDRI